MKASLFLLLFANLAHADAGTFACTLFEDRAVLAQVSLSVKGKPARIHVDHELDAVIGAGVTRDKDHYFGIEIQDRTQPNNDSNVLTQAWAATDPSVDRITVGTARFRLVCSR